MWPRLWRAKVRQPGSHPACSHKGHMPLGLASGSSPPSTKLTPTPSSHPLRFALSSTPDGQSLPSCPLGLWDSQSLPLALASRENVCVTRAGLG